MSIKEKLAEVFLDCGKLSFAVLLASGVLNNTDGEINVVLVFSVTFILFLIGFIFVRLSKGDKK